MWHLFHYVSNCPECTVESEKKTAFEEHLTQKHQFLFVYFYEYEFGFISSKFGIVQSVVLTHKQKMFVKNI